MSPTTHNPQSGRAAIWALAVVAVAVGAVALAITREQPVRADVGDKAQDEFVIPETDRVVSYLGRPLGKPTRASAEPLTPQMAGKNKIIYPGGFAADTLNGVKKPIQLTWKQGSYTTIVAKESTYWEGIGVIEWYVHEDGTRSTTLGAAHGHNPPIGYVVHTDPPYMRNMPPPKTVVMDELFQKSGKLGPPAPDKGKKDKGKKDKGKTSGGTGAGDTGGK